MGFGTGNSSCCPGLMHSCMCADHGCDELISCMGLTAPWQAAGRVGLCTRLSLCVLVSAVAVQDFLKVSLRMMGRLSLCNWRLKHTWLTQPHMKVDPMPEPPSWDKVKVPPGP